MQILIVLCYLNYAISSILCYLLSSKQIHIGVKGCMYMGVYCSFIRKNLKVQ